MSIECIRTLSSVCLACTDLREIAMQVLTWTMPLTLSQRC